VKIYEYPKCTTCKKAIQYLEKYNEIYEDINIKENCPSKDELKKYIELSKRDIDKCFNTSGLKYRELNLKDKLKKMSTDEKLELLSSDGMLLKRPILVSENVVLFGFKEDEWNKIIKK